MEPNAAFEIEVRVCTGATVVFRVGPSVKLLKVFGHVEARFAPDPGHSLVYYFGDVRLDGEQRVGEASLISGSVVDCQHVADRIGPAKPSLVTMRRPAETQQEAPIHQDVAAASSEAEEASVDQPLAEADGRTALHWAAFKGHHEEIRQLLRDGAQPGATDGDGCTPLILAAAQGHMQAVGVLVVSMTGREVDAADELGRTALYHAACMGHLEVVDLLLRSGAKDSLRGRRGVTPLFIAATRRHAAVVRRLVQHMGRERLKVKGAGGRTVLHHAAWERQEGLVGLLLASGVESDIQDEDGMTALTLASSRGHVEVVRLLALHMAQQDREGAEEQLASALQHAAYIGHEKVVALLLDMEVTGAIPRISDEAKKAAIICAAVGGRLRICPMLQKSMRDESAMGTARGGRVALEWSALAGHAQAKVILMHRGVSPRKWRRQTPLMKACQEGLVGVVQVLTWGLDRQELSAGDIKGATALHYAALSGHEHVVALLLKRGADPWSKLKKGGTPLTSAILRGHTGVARNLLEHMGGQGLEEGDQGFAPCGVAWRGGAGGLAGVRRRPTGKPG